MIDIDAIRQRHLRPEQMEGRTYYEGHIVIDLAALCDEVAALRHDVADLRMLRDEHQIDTMHAYDEGGHAERAAVVAWLDAQQPDIDFCDCCGQRGTTVDQLTSAIERGEHRKEKPCP